MQPNAGVAVARGYDNIIVFGDSLSDDGNLYALTGKSFPPSSIEIDGVTYPGYYDGRSTNGFVWVELLPGYASHLNFAQAGALTNSTNIHDTVAGACGVQQQIAAFKGSISLKDAIILWSGGNDIHARRRPSDIVTDQIENIHTLIELGARTILVPNLPDLGATPLIKGTQNQRRASIATRAFNEGLANAIRNLNDSAPVKIIHMDVFTAMSIVLKNPATFGFADINAPCMSIPPCLNAFRTMQNRNLFWDDRHPTSAAHRLMALYASLLLSHDTTASLVSLLAEFGLLLSSDMPQTAFNHAMMKKG